MIYQKVTAIIRCDALEKVESVLQSMGVHGISVTKVKGYGEYADFYSSDWMVSHSRIEIFTDEAQADLIAQAIMNSAHTGAEGDGIVAILPVERLYRIRTRSEATASEI
ncbi:MAG: P-II family nitrogen regulator [Candidatus Polarisedimenticolaceae bacterium]|nr:P-II family nitrogen regulator [Candidatus Polarisedimenticolaceae bacterium]